MMFAKPDAAHSTKHELMAYGVITVPPEAPSDGRSITFAGIPVNLVGKRFKKCAPPAGEIPEAGIPGTDPASVTDELLLRVRLRVWQGKSYARHILDGENGAAPDLSGGAINWISMASKLAGGNPNDIGAAVLSAQASEGNTGDTEAIKEEAKRRYEKRRKADDDKRKQVESEAAAVSEKWRKKRADDDGAKMQQAEAAAKKKAADEAKQKADEAAKKKAEAEEKKRVAAEEAKMAADELAKKKAADEAARIKKEAEEKKRLEEERKKKEAEEAARKKREEEARAKKVREDEAATKIQNKQREKVAKAELARRKALLEAQRAKYKARYKRKLDALQNALDEYRTICDTNMKDAQAREQEQADLKAMTSASSILVAARFRPLMGRELKLGTGQVSDELVLEKLEGQEVSFRENKFTMDYVFGMESQQELVFAPARSECQSIIQCTINH